jgi:N,N'-diacetyllegionaminate synthase
MISGGSSIIAEVGSVHDGSYGNACKLIELAARCGADAVKFQTHIADAETLADAPPPPFFEGEPRAEYFRRTGFDIDQWRGLKNHAKAYGITFLSSPFSLEAIDLLETVGVEAYKVPSGEVTNLPLLERIASTGKPCLLSSGMSNWDELDRAVDILKSGTGSTIVMQCSSIYPCPPEHFGLNILSELKRRYGLDVGYSDHSISAAAPIAAVALGATVVEKHLTFSRDMYGSDASNAMEPNDFSDMAEGIRAIWYALENPVDKNCLETYSDMKRIFEKSMVTAHAVPAGTLLALKDVAFKKPGDGISAGRYQEFLGREVRRDLPADYKIVEEDIL